ncbi:hypothetical protein [Microbacterium sp. SLBN-111]|uniref:hypothetical protein n=1 Tax=Microbacterium sp. SLBN-111 TaxID=3377733 RepID=UPI003C72197E
MKTVARVLGTLSLLAALASLAVQAVVVARLWTAYVETFPLRTTLGISAAGAALGLALAVAAVFARRRSLGVLPVISGLLNLGLLAGYGYLFLVL